MSLSLSIDRFEGEGKSIAVLISDEGEITLNVPKELLPKGSKPGDVIRLSLEKDQTATETVAQATRKVQDSLRSRDTGEDLRI